MLILFCNTAYGRADDVFYCSSKVGSGIGITDNVYSFKDEGIKTIFKIKVNTNVIKFKQENTTRNYKIISKRNKPNGSISIISYHIDEYFYKGDMLTLALNDKRKEYLYTHVSTGAGEVFAGPIGSRGKCDRF